MKHKVLITSFDLEIGGAERSLLGLLNSFDYNKYEVDLFLYAHTGEFMPFLPKSVNLLPEVKPYSMIKKPIVMALFGGGAFIAVSRLLSKCFGLIKLKMGGCPGDMLVRNCRYCLPFFPRLEKKYDIVLSFTYPHYLATDRVTAKLKLGWIHTDYVQVSSGIDKNFELPMWQRLDFIAAVSAEVKYSFISVFPELHDKVMVIENILSAEFVRQQAAEKNVSAEMPPEPGVVRLCSVGRFCHAKNFESIPEIVRRLMQPSAISRGSEISGGNAPTQLNAPTIKWYLIGYGGDEALIRAKITEAGVGDQVIILGKKTNPYPYMQACDLYVQPSRYEGKAVTVREAQMLGRPVLITNFPTAKSQLEDGVDGLICPLDNAAIADAIRHLIEDGELRNRLAQTAATRDYSNAGEVEKIYRLMEP